MILAYIHALFARLCRFKTYDSTFLQSLNLIYANTPVQITPGLRPYSA